MGWDGMGGVVLGLRWAGYEGVSSRAVSSASGNGNVERGITHHDGFIVLQLICQHRGLGVISTSYHKRPINPPFLAGAELDHSFNALNVHLKQPSSQHHHSHQTPPHPHSLPPLTRRTQLRTQPRQRHRLRRSIIIQRIEQDPQVPIKVILILLHRIFHLSQS